MAGAPAVLFANPTAQSGKAAEWIRVARAHLDAAGVPHRFVATAPAGGTVELVERAIDDDGARVVIAMGGDGTFSEVAKGVLGSQHAARVAMGLLPTGTANDQAKSFGMSAGPDALEANVAVLVAGATIAVDVGRLEVWDRGDRSVHRDLFFDSFSVGLGAATLATRNRDRELVGKIPGLGLVYRDQLVYAGALVQRFLESYVVDVKFDLDVVVDGRVVHYADLLDVIVKNTRIFGGEWVLDPGCEADDGLFELVPITGRRDFGTKAITAFRHSPITDDDLRNLGFERAEAVPGARFELVVRAGDAAPPAAQADGEEIPAGDRYQIAVVPRGLRVIVPREEVTGDV
jgi:diacylglycerol kinase family enzyme